MNKWGATNNYETDLVHYCIRGEGFLLFVLISALRSITVALQITLSFIGRGRLKLILVLVTKEEALVVFRFRHPSPAYGERRMVEVGRIRFAMLTDSKGIATILARLRLAGFASPVSISTDSKESVVEVGGTSISCLT